MPVYIVKFIGIVLSVFAMLFVGTAVALPDALSFTGVSADRALMRKGEAPVSIRFRISRPTAVTLNIYDARDVLIRSIASPDILDAGDHELSWDGMDAVGNFVPTEAYHYTLSSGGDDERVVYDLTDKSGGETVLVDKIEYDADRKVVRYELPSSARVFVRIGIEDGSVLRTLVNGAIRQAGVIEDPWDGYDESGVISLGNHPKLQLFAEGFKISRNTIVVINDDPLPTRPVWVPMEVQDSLRRVAEKKVKGLNHHAYHDRDQCRDAKIALLLPDHLPKTADGLPIISGPVPLRMEIAPEDSDMLEAQRFEVVYFLNNQMIYENEVSYTPYTWVWEPKVMNGGVNYMTAFIVGFGRHFGVATVKFVLGEPQPVR
jgi:flagellar hook assembly protein FlgD